LKCWKPKNEWHGAEKQPVGWVESSRPTILHAGQVVGLEDSARPTASHAPGHAAASGEPGGVSARSTAQEPPLTVWNMTVAWAPYAIMSVFLLLTGFVRQKEGTGLVYLGPIQTNYMIPIPGLHRESY